MSDSQSTYQNVAAYFGVPAIIAGYFYQPDIVQLASSERTSLLLLTIATMGALSAVLEMVTGHGKRSVLVAIILVAAAWNWNTTLAPHHASALANDRRCLAIQRDMLSARPRRADGPDLFQALGCRPQGEGSVYAPPQRGRTT